MKFLNARMFALGLMSLSLPVTAAFAHGENGGGSSAGGQDALYSCVEEFNHTAQDLSAQAFYDFSANVCKFTVEQSECLVDAFYNRHADLEAANRTCL